MQRSKKEFPHKCELKFTQEEFDILQRQLAEGHFTTMTGFVKHFLFKKISEVNNERR